MRRVDVGIHEEDSDGLDVQSFQYQRELFELGTRLVAKGKFAEGAGHLAALLKQYRLQDNIYRQAVQSLFRAALAIGDQVRTGTWFMNRCDYLDPALAWVGVKDSGRGCTLSRVGYEHLTRPKSFHLRRI